MNNLSKLAACSALLLAACSPYSPDLGDEPFRCGEQSPKCPDGYECVGSPSSPTGVCRKSGGDDTGGADAGTSASAWCDDDAAYEPNEGIDEAYVTPLSFSQAQLTLDSLSVCPGDDVDVYRLRVDRAGQDIVAKVTTERADGELMLEFLNTSGTVVFTGTYTDGQQLAGTLPNASRGAWHLRVRGSNSSVQNRYALEVELVDP